MRLDVDQTAWYEQTADASGTATFTLNAPLSDGPHALIVFASDKAANNSPETDTTFTVSTAVVSLREGVRQLHAELPSAGIRRADRS